MEYIDLVSKIIAAEHRAQAIAKAAVEQQESLDADLEREVAELRADFFRRAERRIALVEETERAAAGEDMALWDKKLEQALAEVESAYTKSKDAWVDLLFHRIVGD